MRRSIPGRFCSIQSIARRFQDCGIALLDSPGDIVPVVLIYLGS